METITKEIVAWRGWWLRKYDDGWRLHSITMKDVCWDGPAFVADVVPTDANANGVYALATREALEQAQYTGGCLGEVALSGIVVEGSNGYRAERATIRSLTLLGWPASDVRPVEVIADLEARYQCEVSWEVGGSGISTTMNTVNGKGSQKVLALPPGTYQNCYFQLS